mgnify:CR=1 FL=1
MFYPKHWRKSLTALAVVAVALVSRGWAVNAVLHAAALGSKMHVTQVSVGWEYSGASKQPHAYVFIRDEFGNPVNGALVTGDWSGCNTKKGASATTQTFYNPDGTIRFDGAAQVFGRKHSCLKSNCNFTFTVTNVSMTRMTYDPASNVTSSGSAPCNPLF